MPRMLGGWPRRSDVLGLDSLLNVAAHDTTADTSVEGAPLRVPRARVCERGGFRLSVMPKRLKRIYEFCHRHFLTFGCYRRLPLAAIATEVHTNNRLQPSAQPVSLIAMLKESALFTRAGSIAL